MQWNEEFLYGISNVMVNLYITNIYIIFKMEKTYDIHPLSYVVFNKMVCCGK